MQLLSAHDIVGSTKLAGRKGKINIWSAAPSQPETARQYPPVVLVWQKQYVAKKKDDPKFGDLFIVIFFVVFNAMKVVVR